MMRQFENGVIKKNCLKPNFWYEQLLFINHYLLRYFEKQVACGIKVIRMDVWSLQAANTLCLEGYQDLGKKD